MKDYQLSDFEQNDLKQEIIRKNSEQLRKRRIRTSVYDFEPLAIVGRGAFGEVRVCKNKNNGKIVALKKLFKEEMHNKNQIIHVRTEKAFLQLANHDHIVELYSSFQDEKFLYLEMEFLLGGDLMSQLIKKDIFTEYEAKFYCAQIISAIEYIHSKKCIHRDIKPDNILIDKQGNIKLSDFGLSKTFDKNIYQIDSQLHQNGINLDLKHITKSRKKRILAFSTVGTPDYIAPEVFGDQGYGPEVDWWSLGAILFEMVIGYPPFYSENSKETCKKIINFKKFLKYPPNVKVSEEVKDLMSKLMNDVDKRIGYNGSEEIKRHPWFKGIDWNNLKLMKAPFIPKTTNDYDTKYFEILKEKNGQGFYHIDARRRNVNKDICFLDFSFENEKKSLKLTDIFEELEETKRIRKLREKSCGLKHYEPITKNKIFNAHTNFQSTFTELSEGSIINSSSANNLVTINNFNQNDKNMTMSSMKEKKINIEKTDQDKKETTSLSKPATNRTIDTQNMLVSKSNIKILPILKTQANFKIGKLNLTSLNRSVEKYIQKTKINKSPENPLTTRTNVIKNESKTKLKTIVLNKNMNSITNQTNKLTESKINNQTLSPRTKDSSTKIINLKGQISPSNIKIFSKSPKNPLFKISSGMMNVSTGFKKMK